MQKHTSEQEKKERKVTRKQKLRGESWTKESFAPLPKRIGGQTRQSANIKVRLTLQFVQMFNRLSWHGPIFSTNNVHYSRATDMAVMWEFSTAYKWCQAPKTNRCQWGASERSPYSMLWAQCIGSSLVLSLTVRTLLFDMWYTYIHGSRHSWVSYSGNHFTALAFSKMQDFFSNIATK